MGTRNGLSVLDPEKGLLKYFYEKDGIPEDFVLDFLLDDDQRVWVGTFNGGLSVIGQHGEMVRPVGTKALSTLLEDSEGRIWIGAGNAVDGIEIVTGRGSKPSI